MVARREKKKLKIGSIFVFVIILILIGGVIYYFSNGSNTSIVFDDYTNKKINDLEEFAKANELKIEKDYQYSLEYEKDIIISLNKNKGDELKKGDVIKAIVSKGDIPKEELEKNKINENGNVPIMMYHGIHDMKDSDTKYTGGNVDKDGYNRTAESFRKDLEFYYQNNYRMIRLTDYVDGIIDVEMGKTPIILTFDDGKENNFKVLGEKDGKLEIDPNCAVGVLEEFKKKYPDFHVTATFFVNGGIFEQEKYNEKILRWLVDNGYDVGNHTMTHPDFTKIGAEQTKKEVGGIYKILENIIPKKYVNIIAMPFGSPYKKSHPNFELMLNGEYEGLKYNTKSMLRVGWEAELSPFNKEFDKTFLKRIRAYDNNGKDFDIKMNFDLLEKNRFISDGDKNIVTVRDKDKDNISTDKKVRTY